MKRSFLFIFIGFLFCLCGCDTATKLPEFKPEIVVEGWIESGGHPVVMVTTSIPVNETVTDTSGLKQHVVNWAKVTISDGIDEIVLTGQKDERYFPPYIYTSVFMRGEAGKTYTLKVEYGGKTAIAETSIPLPKKIEYIKVLQSKDNEGDYYMTGGIKDDPATKDYYKVFTRVAGKDSLYVPSFMGLTDDAILSNEISEIIINQGCGKFNKQIDTYFSAEDIVSIRFCTLDEASWKYWNDYDEIFSLSRNPFFPVSTRIRSNIKGGLGYWAGYGSSYYRVNIPDSIRLGRVY